MATVSRDGTGRYRIEYVSPFSEGPRRPKIRLGRVQKRQADHVRSHVEQLIAAKITGHTIPNSTATWLNDIRANNPHLAERLTKLKLVDPVVAAATTPVPCPTIKEFVDKYISTFRTTRKPSTVLTWEQARRLLLEYFDGDTPIDTITTGHAIEFQNYLRTRERSRRQDGGKMSEHTIRRRTGCIKQFFAHAVELELISHNPFTSKQIATTAPKPRQKYFVSHDLSVRIVQRLPHAQWRLLFALARWGGLRVPSEPRTLTWANVDWEKRRLTVHSPKTEHHEGHETRVIPLFPEIIPHLQDVWDAAEPGEPLILPFMAGKSDSLFRKPLIRVIESLGVARWDNLFNALRATRDTELREIFPSHVVDKWIGHDEAVAKKHYVQVTEDHYDRAAHFAAQNTAATVSNPEQTKTATPEKPRALPLVSAPFGALLEVEVGPEGLEPPTKGL